MGKTRPKREIDGPPPTLVIRGERIGSKDWVPRNTLLRIGAFLYGAVFVVAGLMMIVGSMLFKGEFQREISSPATVFLVSLVAVSMALAAASLSLFYGVRLLRSSFRQSPISKNQGPILR